LGLLARDENKLLTTNSLDRVFGHYRHGLFGSTLIGSFGYFLIRPHVLGILPL